jgi:hypothetical protein
MEDPSSKHLWFEALGGLMIIAAIAAFFVIAVVRSEKKAVPEEARHTVDQMIYSGVQTRS